jgi:hypothetical protein
MDAMTRRLLPLLIALGLVTAACSGGADGSTPAATTGAPSSSFAAQVGSTDLYVGAPQRVEVGVFSSTGASGVQLLSYGQVGFSFSYLGTDGSSAPTPGPQATADYLGAPGTQTTGEGPALTDPGTSRGVYEASVTFDQAGIWQVDVTADVAGVGTQHLSASFPVLEHPLLPAPGDKALHTDNLTIDSKGVPLSAIDSRAQDGAKIPDPELHRWTIADALAQHRPVLAIFATPVWCQSQFCGPTTDAVQALADRYANRAVFVHVEIWKDFHKSVVNQAAADWLYPPAVQKANGDLTEPWLFLIGADGIIKDRWGPLFDPTEVAKDLAALPPMKG